MQTTQADCTTSETLMAKLKARLALSSTVKCKRCNGNGKTQWVSGADYGTEDCDDCEGSGEMLRCDDCLGDGKVAGVACIECHGHGAVSL